jgi:hypothetical protein
MIHGTREAPYPASFDLAPGHTRTQIAGLWVEWSGVRPEPQDVADHLRPPPAVLQAQAADQAAKLFVGTDPALVLFRAKARADFKLFKTLIPALTWLAYKQRILDEMPTDDPAA